MDTDHLRPICEPSFRLYGREYIAHVVPHCFGIQDVYEITVHDSDDITVKRAMYGTYGKRLVSDDMPSAIRKAAEAAVKGALGC